MPQAQAPIDSAFQPRAEPDAASALRPLAGGTARIAVYSVKRKNDAMSDSLRCVT